MGKPRFHETEEPRLSRLPSGRIHIKIACSFSLKPILYWAELNGRGCLAETEAKDLEQFPARKDFPPPDRASSIPNASSFYWCGWVGGSVDLAKGAKQKRRDLESLPAAWLEKASRIGAVIVQLFPGQPKCTRHEWTALRIEQKPRCYFHPWS